MQNRMSVAQERDVCRVAWIEKHSQHKHFSYITVSLKQFRRYFQKQFTASALNTLLHREQTHIYLLLVIKTPPVLFFSSSSVFLCTSRFTKTTNNKTSAKKLKVAPHRGAAPLISGSLLPSHVSLSLYKHTQHMTSSTPLWANWFD